MDSPSPTDKPQERPVQGARPIRVYVASSWRNEYQPSVVMALREDGHTVYDFRDAEGFHWSEVDPDWRRWPGDILKYIRGLDHPCAVRGFNRDMNALRGCDVCVYVMPCGVSASLEFGWAVGAKKRTIAYIPTIREPDLMVKMADVFTQDFTVVRNILRQMSLGRADLQSPENSQDSTEGAQGGQENA